MFSIKMTTEGTPERVFVLLNTIKSGKGALTRKQIQDLMEPRILDQSGYFNAYFSVAEELGMIEENDGTYSVKEQYLDCLKSFDTFRKSVNNRLQEYSSGPFYLMTKAYLQIFPTVIRKYGDKPDITQDDVKRLVNQEVQKIKESRGLSDLETFDNPELLGWRFWASALGFGWLLGTKGTTVLANPAGYLNDLIQKKVQSGDLIPDQEYTVTEFMEKLSPESDLLITDDQLKNRLLPYSLSSALLTLDKTVLDIKNQMDERAWQIDPEISAAIGQEISLISIRREPAYEQ